MTTMWGQRDAWIKVKRSTLTLLIEREVRKALRLWNKSSYIRERGRQARREEQQTYFQKRTPRWAELPQKKVEQLEQMRGKEHVSKESKLVWRRKASVAVVVGEGATDGKKPQKGSEECPQAKDLVNLF
jgi:hypothetical protein